MTAVVITGRWNDNVSVFGKLYLMAIVNVDVSTLSCYKRIIDQFGYKSDMLVV